MKFECINDSFIELNVIGYQYPDETNDKWDSNWLKVNLEIKTSNIKWCSLGADPIITTFELKELITWFKNILENKMEKHEKIEFTEPNISFEYLDEIDSKIKKINMKLVPEYGKIYNVELIITNDQINYCINDLGYILIKYPERGIIK